MKPMDGPDGKDASTTRTLSRGLALLAALLDAPTPPTLTELATQTGLAKATASRLLATLVDEGFAAQSPGGAGFLAGPSIARWLRTSPLEALLAEQASPALRELRRLTGETAVLCTAVWPDRVCIAADRSEAPVRAQKSVGEVGPLTRGCTGRAFLAFAPDAYVNAALEARPLCGGAPHSVTDPDDFRALLVQERSQGYTLSWEGTFPDMSGITAPVFSPDSELPVAVLNISGPSARWTPDVMRSFAPVLLEHADRLSALLRSRKAS